MSTIEEYNQDSAERLIKYTLDDYFKYIHSKYFKHINIDFMSYFLSLVPRKNEFCVEHIKLQEYNVLNNIKSCNIKDCLQKFNLIENVHYLLLNVQQQDLSNKHGGHNKKDYLLTPHAFKLCLMRAKNSFEYSNYYILLEQIHYYYKDYEMRYYIRLVSIKDDKIDSLNEKIDKQSKDIEELLKYGKRTTDKLDETNEKLDDMKEELDETNEKLDETAEKLDDLHDKFDDMKDAFEETAGRSVPNPEEEEKRSEFVLLQSRDDPNEFKFMRGIQKYNEVRLNNLYAGEYNIIKREYNANPIQLFNLLKKVVKEELDEAKDEIRGNKNIKNKRQLYKEMVEIKFTSTKLILMNNFTLNDLLRKIKNVADMKFKKYEDATEDAP